MLKLILQILVLAFVAYVVPVQKLEDSDVINIALASAISLLLLDFLYPIMFRPVTVDDDYY